MSHRRIEAMVVVVTGASSGIGRAAALALADHGAHLILAARRVDRLHALCDGLPGTHLAVAADVSRPADCRTLIDKALGRYGRIDALVGNAGVGLVRAADELTAADMEAVYRTNVLGTTECARHAVRQMRRQGLRDGWRGQVLIVSSAAARRGLPGFAAYTASKAAQLSWAEALRVELAPERIAVTCVHPGGTRTEFFRTAIRLSGARPPRDSGRIEVRHTADNVADTIVRALERPRAEAWPSLRMRWLMGLAVLFPSITDRVVARRLHRARPRLRPSVEGVPSSVDATVEPDAATS